jgi:hypothetical protein
MTQSSTTYGRGAARRSDDDIRRDVRRLLAHQLHGQAPGVQVEVADGAVLMSGEQRDRAALRELNAAIEKLEGVAAVRIVPGSEAGVWPANPIWHGSVSTYGARARHHLGTGT